MELWPNVIAPFAAIFFSIHLIVKYRRNLERKRRFPFELFREAKGLLENASIENGTAVGSHWLTGFYKGLPARVETVVDTLAVRKLPSLWVMVTIPAPIPVKATFDMMMRPAGATTFSNFDFLPQTLDAEPGFPKDALVRTNDRENLIPTDIVKPYLEPFYGNQAKELLITPSGIRIVTQIAEADRARYGVLRQAEFGDVVLEAPLLKDTLDRLVDVRQAIINWSQNANTV